MEQIIYVLHVFELLIGYPGGDDPQAFNYIGPGVQERETRTGYKGIPLLYVRNLRLRQGRWLSGVIQFKGRTVTNTCSTIM